MKTAVFILISLFLAAGPAGCGALMHAQETDLVKLKKEEEERRKKLAESKHKEVVVTNESLKKYGEKDKKSAVSTTNKPSPQAAPEKPEKVDPKQTREYWQDLKNRIETNLKELRALVERQQLEYNRLFTQHLLMDLPLEKQRLKRELDQMEQTLKLNKTRLANAQEEYDSLPERARKAGVPPGWIR